MITWMLYVVVITLLLSGAAVAAEQAARRRRTRSRWIWAVTIVVPTLIASVSIQVPSLLTPTVSRRAIPLRDLTSVQVVPLTWVREHTGNVVATRGENLMLQRAWITVSVTLLAALVLNGLQVVWRKRRWRVGIIAGVSVYIAPDAGPAVVGLFRPRIVLPDWLLEASPSRQVIVLTHERSHLAAHDPQLLTVALFLLVLMPWNLPLWWQLHRLRWAIEVDCDARVLKSGVDTEQYGEMLLDASQRPSGYIGSVAAMAESGSFLEERIAIMVRNPAKWGSLVVVAFGCVAVALLAVAAQVTPPNVGPSDSERQPIALTPDILDQYVGFYLRAANLVFAITREGDHLELRTPYVPLNEPPLELEAQTQTSFALKIGGPHLVFARERWRSPRLSILYALPGGASFSVPLSRIDASTAERIKASNELRARSQTPLPGSDAALRRLIGGILADELPYDVMSPWYAELVKEAGHFTRMVYEKRGAIRSIEFLDVSPTGADVYRVRQEGGVSTWFIYLDANGLIQDADDASTD
jgi:bla regulator protein BlaR1